MKETIEAFALSEGFGEKHEILLPFLSIRPKSTNTNSPNNDNNVSINALKLFEEIINTKDKVIASQEKQIGLWKQ